MSELTAIIEKNLAAGRLTKIPFLPAAFPTAASFWPCVVELADSGADIIEIGVPFSDPVADGPTVAAASQKAIANGASLGYIFAGLEKYRARVKAGLVLMGYANPFLQFAGLDLARPGAMDESLAVLAKAVAGHGVGGLIVPDLPLEESAPWQAALKAAGLDLIALVGPNTPPAKMAQYAASGASGYVYAVSVMGITGARQGLPPAAAETVRRAKEAFGALPVALGFGLSSPGQLAGLSEEERPAAAVFGSALIRHLEAGGQAADFMAAWA